MGIVKVYRGTDIPKRYLSYLTRPVDQTILVVPVLDREQSLFGSPIDSTFLRLISESIRVSVQGQASFVDITLHRRVSTVGVITIEGE